MQSLHIIQATVAAIATALLIKLGPQTCRTAVTIAVAPTCPAMMGHSRTGSASGFPNSRIAKVPKEPSSRGTPCKHTTFPACYVKVAQVTGNTPVRGVFWQGLQIADVT